MSMQNGSNKVDANCAERGKVVKPNNRKSRLDWLREKKGIDYVMSMYALTDREVKEWFERVYQIYKDLPKYEYHHEHPKCLVCNSEIKIIWECACGENEGVIDEDDPDLASKRERWESA